MQVLVQHQRDLCMPICNALSLPDLILESNVTVAGVRLPRVMQLVAPKTSGLCKALVRSRESLLQSLQKMMRLTFAWPEHLEEEPDFMTWWWKCPQCRFPYPVQAPEALTGVSLLRRALPGVEEFIDAPARDLWALSSLSLPARKTNQHVLREFNNSFGIAGPAKCSSCGQPVGSILFVCQLCGLFVCQLCEKQHQATGALCCPPGPVEGKAGVAYNMLSKNLEGRFDLSPILDFGSLERFVSSEQPLAMAAAQKLLQRKGGQLEPLKSPYEYYARAALLQVQARRVTAKERFQLLQEACVALQDCMAAPGSNINNLYNIESNGNPTGGGPMEKDPRVWYLLGLVLCDLGSFEEARKAYRQSLGRLPMYYFSHVVHFNLALLRSRDGDPGACAATAAALRELRRCCGTLRPRNQFEKTCWICGK